MAGVAYVSVTKAIPFTRPFLEMTLISFGVPMLSFAIGFAERESLGIET